MNVHYWGLYNAQEHLRLARARVIELEAEVERLKRVHSQNTQGLAKRLEEARAETAEERKARLAADKAIESIREQLKVPRDETLVGYVMRVIAETEAKYLAAKVNGAKARQLMGSPESEHILDAVKRVVGERDRLRSLLDLTPGCLNPSRDPGDIIRIRQLEAALKDIRSRVNVEL